MEATSEGNGTDPSQEGHPCTPGLRYAFPPDERKAKILAAIERARKYDVNKVLKLPELVVCGKQSSGKSSVLEAISGIPFPKGEGTCTKFVTEITLLPNTDGEDFLKGSISPPVEGFKSEKRGHNKLESVLNEAKVAIEKSLGETSPKIAQLSRHVLRIDIHLRKTKTDKDQSTAPRVTLVDVPGLISLDGQEISQNITFDRIKEKNVIILAVVDAVNDTKTHDIVKLTRSPEVDPTGARTFGIVTKPDLIEPESKTERTWVNEVKGHGELFKLGAHVLLNLTTTYVKDGKTLDDRDVIEKNFFENKSRRILSTTEDDRERRLQNGWHELFDTDLWGVKKLQKRLADLITEHAMRELPSLVQDVRMALKKQELEQTQLGISDPKKQRTDFRAKLRRLYLTADHGAKGTYGEQRYFDAVVEPVRWLRARICTENSELSLKMRAKGHSPRYAWSPDDPMPMDAKATEVEQLLQSLMSTRGPHPYGNFDTNRVTTFFVQFSSPWKDLAEEYIRRCSEHCENFLEDVTRFYIPSKALAERFLAHELLPGLSERKKTAIEELQQLEDDRMGLGFSENPIFWKESAKMTHERHEHSAKEKRGEKREEKTEEKREKKRDEKKEGKREERTKGKKQNTATPEQTTNRASGQVAIEDDLGKDALQDLEVLKTEERKDALKILHLILLTYKVERERYIDNIRVQVVERHLLREFADLFSEDWMDDEGKYNMVMHDPDQEVKKIRQQELSDAIEVLKGCLQDLEGLLSQGSYS